MNWVHICVDMQRLFVERTEWHMPWAARVLPQLTEVVAAHPEATIFTRFVPVRKVEQAHGTWRRYYQRWESMTLDRLGEDMVDLVPALQRFVPPGVLVDKTVYSPWLTPALSDILRERGTDTVVVTGGETDVCVLATVLGAVDRGFFVVLANDALCSSSDQSHDALLGLYEHRYSRQIVVLPTQDVLARWGDDSVRVKWK